MMSSSPVASKALMHCTLCVKTSLPHSEIRKPAKVSWILFKLGRLVSEYLACMCSFVLEAEMQEDLKPHHFEVRLSTNCAGARMALVLKTYSGNCMKLKAPAEC